MIQILKNVLLTGRATEKKSTDDSFLFADGPGLVALDGAKCSKCPDRACVKACPTKALAESGGTVRADSKKCIECRMCGDVCRHGAVSYPDYGLGSEAMAMAAEKLENEVRANFGGSFHIRQLDVGSCNGCEHEMISAGNPVFDLTRFGIDFVASPRHADCLLVTGPVTWNLRESLIRTIEATPKPRVVVAMGTCACSGEPFEKNYANYGGVDRLLPVDLYIPGCPPHPYSLLRGLLGVMKKHGGR